MNFMMEDIYKHRILTKKENFIITRNKNFQVQGDFYATPHVIIRALLDKEVLHGDIWEPACGNGAISRVLREYGHDVYSSDLYNRGFGDAGVDFLSSERRCDTIITNPPFNIIDKFLHHAKKLAESKIIFIASTNFLKGKRRVDNYINDEAFPLTKVYLLDTTINYLKNGVPPKTRTGFMSSCICVFEKNKNKEGIMLDFLQV